jgi:hypothetical protein
MKNITEDIKKALSIDVLWSIEQFYLFIEFAKKENFEINYWDGEENWAIISLNNNKIGYIWQKCPLVLISREYSEHASNLFSMFNYVVTIIVENLVSKELIIDIDSSVFDRMGELGYGKPLSATDIWFDTVN